MFYVAKCDDYTDKGAALIVCNDNGRRAREAHGATRDMACACAASFDYEIPDSLAAPKVTLIEEYKNLKHGKGLTRFDVDAAPGTVSSFNALGPVPCQTCWETAWASLFLRVASQHKLGIWVQERFDGTLGYPGEGPPAGP